MKTFYYGLLSCLLTSGRGFTQQNMLRYEEKYTALPQGYNLVVSNPMCRSLGSGYCPRPNVNQTESDLYMSHFERTQMALINAARSFAPQFRVLYPEVSYACSVPNWAMKPLRYDPALQQVAKQQAFFLNDPNCTLQHETCPKYCRLYGGNCDWIARVSRYQPNWRGLGEIIVNAPPRDPWASLQRWLRSGTHCGILFGGDWDYIGVGSFGGGWASNFRTDNDPNRNPLYSGSHWRHPTMTKGRTRFFLTYSTWSPQSGPGVGASSVRVNVNNTFYNMSMHIQDGQRTDIATYMWERNATSSCLTYFFTATNSQGAYRLPETGFFHTGGIGTCTKNWTP
jgi:hypothetical protein